MIRSDVLEYIATADRDTLSEVMEIVKIRKDHLTIKARNKLAIGQDVEFSTGRRGRFAGTVTKINRKTAKVKAAPVGSNQPLGNWTVAIPLLEW